MFPARGEEQPHSLQKRLLGIGWCCEGYKRVGALDVSAGSGVL
jgi:hypothetical protein